MRRLPDLSGYLGSDVDSRHCAYIKIASNLQAYRTAYQQIVRGEPASEPVVHIQIPTVHDSSLTQRQGEIVSIWAQFAPAKLSEGSWETRRAEVGEALIDYVTEFIPNFRDDLLDWQLFTPVDIENRVGMTDGNIRHLDTVPDQYLGQRPLQDAGYETPIQGLYLCGAGTHPGGEVTGAPGHNAAQAVLDQLDRRSVD